MWVFTHRDTPVSRMPDGYVLSTLHLMHHINTSGAAMMLQIPGHDVSHTRGPYECGVASSSQWALTCVNGHVAPKDGEGQRTSVLSLPW